MAGAAVSTHPCARPHPCACTDAQPVCGSREELHRDIGDSQFRKRGRGGGGEQSWLCCCGEDVSLSLRLSASLGSHCTFISHGEPHKPPYPLPCVLSNPGFWPWGSRSNDCPQDPGKAEWRVQPGLSRVCRNEDGNLCQTVQRPLGMEVNTAEGVCGVHVEIRERR